MRKLITLGVCIAAFAVGALASEVETPRQIGETITLEAPYRSPAFRPGAREDSEPQLVWNTEVWFPEAEYIAPFFSKFAIPEGAHVVVRSPDGSRSWRYTAEDRARLEHSPEGFWGLHIYGETAIVELYSARPLPADTLVIDRFARGFRDFEMPIEGPGRGGIQTNTICGSDDSQWAKCYQTSQVTPYNKSKAVARLLIGGSSACTGWLVGSEGHVMTNEHCIGSASAAQSVNFEFMAEGSSCSTSCASWGACPGTVVATTSTLIKVSATYDYALVKLPTNPTSTYGYLQMRSTGATLNERIYIPQHPSHWGKKIAMTSAGANAKIDSLSAAACSGGTSDLGYAADTQGGSSGSPVIAYSDNTVIGLHHCGACPNRAVPIQSVITNLGSLKPLNSVAGGTPPPTCTTYTGSLSGTGATSYQPNGTYYQSTISGAHTGNLTGPSGTDFDLYLQKWNGSAWATVASAEGSTSTESITYSGTAGYYVWKIVSYSGSGSYSLCTKKP